MARDHCVAVDSWASLCAPEVKVQVSPLFHEDDQILFFSAPLNYLGSEELQGERQPNRVA
jgi:hypothetical protein